MTEYGIGISGSAALPRERVEATDGVAVAGCDVRIVGRAGEPAAPGEEGDLEIRGAGLFLGYYERPDATREAIVEGWFRTGDRAVIDADGFVSLTGRTKDIVIRGGENLPVAAIESLLHEHPLVVEAAIVGYPDERLGERACAVIALREGGTLALPEVAEFLLGRGLSNSSSPSGSSSSRRCPRRPAGRSGRSSCAAGSSRDFRLGSRTRRRRISQGGTFLMGTPLEGIRVLDFTSLLPGPLATLMLAEAGADVLKIERPDRGDEMRSYTPKFGTDSVNFALLNRGKQSIAIDLKDPARKQRFMALVQEAEFSSSSSGQG